MENLARLCHLIAEKRDAIPHYDYRNDASAKAHKDAVQALVDELSATEGAVIKNSPQGSMIKLSGIRSTSTSGVLGALSNWRAAAQKTIAADVAPFHGGGVVAAKPDQPSFQEGVAQWLLECFGPFIVADKTERADRFIEEALELVQSVGYPAERIMALLSYVYGRSVGEPVQEVGGTMVTLAAFCVSHNIDMDEAAKTELARVWTKIEAIRAKQAAKPTGSALPVAQPSTVVTRQEALDFLGIATRNWSDMPPLCEDDIGDVAIGLSWFIAKRAELDKIEAHLKSLVIANPEKALLAALDDDMRMWFLAELLTVASGNIPLIEIEAIVSRHLTPAKGGAA